MIRPAAVPSNVAIHEDPTVLVVDPLPTRRSPRVACHARLLAVLDMRLALTHRARAARASITPGRVAPAGSCG